MVGGRMTTGNYTVGSSAQALYASKSWSGKDDPAHKAWNPYQMNSKRQVRTPANRYRKDTGAYVDSLLFYGTTLWLPPFSAFTAADEIKLWGKLTDDVRNHSFNLAVSGAEFGQTLGMVVERVQSLTGAFRSARKGDFKKMLQILKAGKPRGGFKSTDVSGVWLEAQYGWKPLAADIYSGMEFLESQTAAPRGFSYERQQSRRLSQEVSNSASIYSIKAIGTVTRKYKIEFTERLSTARSLGLLNPASVLWEKLPWSFVIDWLTPVGTYLDVIGTMPYINATLYRTDFSRGQAKFKAPDRDGGDVVWRGGGVEYQAVAMQRHAPSAVTRESMRFPSLNTLDKVFSLGHIQNAAALVWQCIDNAREYDVVYRRRSRI